ncbi:hypothetical protein [Streptomyces canus]|uniref:hypothetical protein n=1 Tax=Streptomyces canus TaxID=58343 RepID=UPI003869A0D0
MAIPERFPRTESWVVVPATDAQTEDQTATGHPVQGGGLPGEQAAAAPWDLYEAIANRCAWHVLDTEV